MRQDRRASLLKAAGVDVAGLAITYTGTKTDQIVTMSGVAYRLLTLITSGTLTVPKKISADVWMCGGGTSGDGRFTRSGYPNGAGAGGAGAFCISGNRNLNGAISCVIGAGGQGAYRSAFSPGGMTSFGDLSVSVAFSSLSDFYAVSGGTGGGTPHAVAVGMGDGVSKVPFSDSAAFPNPHCPGGGAGGYRSKNSVRSQNGGAGGTNGGNGSICVSGGTAGGTGGNYGGGKGGDGTTSGAYPPTNGSPGSFYGAAGGGSASYIYNDGETSNETNPGNGYQGVIYVRIPLVQAA